MEIGLSSRASAGMSMTSACFAPSNAKAETRSVGRKVLPTRLSSRGSTRSTETPSGASTSTTPSPSPPSGSGSNRPRSRRVGVNRQASSRPVGTGKSVMGLSDRAFHLELDEAVELEGIFHRQLARDGLDEAAHDHRHRLVFGEAARHQVEELVLADLADRRLVAHLHVILADVDVGVGVGTADRVDQKCVALDRAPAVVTARLHLDETAV